VTVDRHEIHHIPQNINVTETSMHHAASMHAVPPKIPCYSNDIDIESNDIYHMDIHNIHDAQMVPMNTEHCTDNDNDMKHDTKSSGNWSQCIVLNGYVNGHDARILFDPGAESNFISRYYISSNDIDSVPCHSTHTGVMADGSALPLNEMVQDATMKIQSYACIVNLYVLDIPHYDIILGVPFHEQHDAVTYHYKRDTYTS
jgi:hypothetical protein